jgi:hypothetical protein
MRRAALTALLITACLFLLVPPAQAWQSRIGAAMDHQCFAVASLKGLGPVAGAYNGSTLYRIDPDTLTLLGQIKLPAKRSIEGISIIADIDGGAGANVFTEDATGPECFTAFGPDWHFTRTRLEYGKGSMYALGGPESVAQGLLAISAGQRRQIGAVLNRWDAGAWRPFTNQLWHDGSPCLIWTATIYNGRLLAGASNTTFKYLDPDVGLLTEWKADHWRYIPTPIMAGIVRLTQLSLDPDALYLCTAHGDIWRTDNLEEFSLYHRGAGYGDSWIHEIYGRRVVTNAKGQVWDDGRLVMDRPGTAWMSPVKHILPDGRQVLIGTITDEGKPFSNVLRIDPPEASP